MAPPSTLTWVSQNSGTTTRRLLGTLSAARCRDLPKKRSIFRLFPWKGFAPLQACAQEADAALSSVSNSNGCKFHPNFTKRPIIINTSAQFLQAS